MAEKTDIEWTDATWNPVTGCSIVSPGCKNCYAMKLAGTRLQHHPSRAGLTKLSKTGPVWTGETRLNKQWLTQPLQWKRPRKIFVCAHGDLFAETVPDEWILDVFTVMAIAHQHTFQVLTKRPERMCDFLNNPDLLEDIYANWYTFDGGCREVWSWPLHNVCLGVSCEDQRRANERIPYLLDTPAAVRFVSAEPLLEGIDFSRWLCLGGLETDLGLSSTGISQIIVGGETGPGSRPMHKDWPRDIRDQCEKANAAFFFKGHGDWATVYDRDNDDPDWRKCPQAANSNERYLNLAGGHGFHGERVTFVRRVGKKQTGRLLDGLEWNQMPQGCAK